MSLPPVAIYEGNAGDLYLHADGGATLYETVLVSGGARADAPWVAEHPDGDAMGWSAELQYPWPGPESHWREIAAYVDGRIILETDAEDYAGYAGRAYLGLGERV